MSPNSPAQTLPSFPCAPNSSTWIQLRCLCASPSGQAGQASLPVLGVALRSGLFFFSFVFFCPVAKSFIRPASSPLSAHSGCCSAADDGLLFIWTENCLERLDRTQDARRQRGQAKYGKLDCQVSRQPDRSSSRGGDPPASHPNPHDMDIGRRRGLADGAGPVLSCPPVLLHHR